MVTLAAVVLAGAAGSVARFVVDGEVRTRWRPRLPWATFGINVSGSLVLGLIAGTVMFHAVAGEWQTVLGTGFCGGYTTFSTASYNTVRLAQQHRPGAALANLVGTLGLSVALCAAGLGIAYAV